MERKGRRGANWSVLIVVVMMSGLTSWQSTPIANNSIYGSFGPEGLRLREQLWVLPSADPSFALRATLFRPETAGNEPTPLVIINHGTDESTRESVAMPVFYWLSRWFVDRGYAVLIPQRRGHGATAGTFAEAIDNCQSPDHARAVQLGLEYDPAPPFDAGSPDKAGAALVAVYHARADRLAPERKRDLVAAAQRLGFGAA